MRILNFGSLNVDYVYRVTEISRPGETISATSRQVFAGGKGANQSVALALAGADVWHAGKVGEDSRWLAEKLAKTGVHTDWLRVSDGPGGHAMIQVDDAGRNSIVIFGGANHEITTAEIDVTLKAFSPGDWLLLQNETNVTGELIHRGKHAGLRLAFNAAPMTDAVRELPLEKLDVLLVNEHEAAALAEMDGDATTLAAALTRKFPGIALVLSLGEKGVLYRSDSEELYVPAFRVQPVDTTGAGDTFIGYWLAGVSRQLAIKEALTLGCRAAALSVTRMGAMDAIPSLAEVEAVAFDS